MEVTCLLLRVWLWLLWQYADALSITGVTPKEGSIAGGTRITITGTGFSDGGGTGNVVKILTSPVRYCNVLGYLSSYDQIVCLTQPRPTSITRR